MAYASESGHWYDREGNAAYQVPNKSKGGMRPTRITDARKLDLLPSVTTIIRTIAAPALENWKVDQGILAALTLPRLDGENDEAFIRRVKEDSKQQAIKAAEFGKRIHGAIEQHYIGMPLGEDLWPYVQGVVGEVTNATGFVDGWSTERSFVNNELGYGGCVDLHRPEWIIDFKGKDGALENEKLWDEQYMQLAAYRKGLASSARCAICYFSRTNPGVAKFMEVPDEELQRGWEMFRAALELWKHQKRYFP